VTGLRIGLCGAHEYASAPLLDFLELADHDLTIRIDDNNPLSLHGFGAINGFGRVHFQGLAIPNLYVVF
jgi:hypothetical protein